MTSDPNVRTVLLVTALAAVAATSWATNETIPLTTWVYDSDALEETSPAPPQEELAAPERDMVNGRETAASGEPESADAIPSNAHIPAASEPPPAIDPKVETPAHTMMDEGAPQPPIMIEERRLTLDERIQGNVMDLLAQASNLSGKIGVESQDAVVTLSGYTTTAGQAQRAGRYAASVEGVKAVQNQIRPRVGGSV
jgi:hyperosmotically inducible periplasmic protein